MRSFMLQGLEREEWKLKNHRAGRPQARVYILIGLTWIAFLSKVINSKAEVLLRISVRSRCASQFRPLGCNFIVTWAADGEK